MLLNRGGFGGALEFLKSAGRQRKLQKDLSARISVAERAFIESIVSDDERFRTKQQALVWMIAEGFGYEWDTEDGSWDEQTEISGECVQLINDFGIDCCRLCWDVVKEDKAQLLQLEAEVERIRTGLRDSQHGYLQELSVLRDKCKERPIVEFEKDEVYFWDPIQHFEKPMQDFIHDVAREKVKLDLMRCGNSGESRLFDEIKRLELLLDKHQRQADARHEIDTKEIEGLKVQLEAKEQEFLKMEKTAKNHQKVIDERDQLQRRVNEMRQEMGALERSLDAGGKRPMTAAGAGDDSIIDQLRNENEQLQGQVDQMQNELSFLRDKKGALEKELHLLKQSRKEIHRDAAIAEPSTSVNALKEKDEEIARLQALADKMKGEAENLQGQLRSGNGNAAREFELQKLLEAERREKDAALNKVGELEGILSDGSNGGEAALRLKLEEAEANFQVKMKQALADQAKEQTAALAQLKDKLETERFRKKEMKEELEGSKITIDQLRDKLLKLTDALKKKGLGDVVEETMKDVGLENFVQGKTYINCFDRLYADAEARRQRVLERMRSFRKSQSFDWLSRQPLAAPTQLMSDALLRAQQRAAEQRAAGMQTTTGTFGTTNQSFSNSKTESVTAATTATTAATTGHGVAIFSATQPADPRQRFAAMVTQDAAWQLAGTQGPPMQARHENHAIEQLRAALAAEKLARTFVEEKLRRHMPPGQRDSISQDNMGSGVAASQRGGVSAYDASPKQREFSNSPSSRLATESGSPPPDQHRTLPFARSGPEVTPGSQVQEVNSNPLAKEHLSRFDSQTFAGSNSQEIDANPGQRQVNSSFDRQRSILSLVAPDLLLPQGSHDEHRAVARTHQPQGGSAAESPRTDWLPATMKQKAAAPRPAPASTQQPPPLPRTISDSPGLDEPVADSSSSVAGPLPSASTSKDDGHSVHPSQDSQTNPKTSTSGVVIGPSASAAAGSVSSTELSMPAHVGKNPQTTPSGISSHESHGRSVPQPLRSSPGPTAPTREEKALSPISSDLHWSENSHGDSNALSTASQTRQINATLSRVNIPSDWRPLEDRNYHESHMDQMAATPTGHVRSPRAVQLMGNVKSQSRSVSASTRLASNSPPPTQSQAAQQRQVVDHTGGSASSSSRVASSSPPPPENKAPPFSPGGDENATDFKAATSHAAFVTETEDALVLPIESRQESLQASGRERGQRTEAAPAGARRREQPAQRMGRIDQASHASPMAKSKSLPQLKSKVDGQSPIAVDRGRTMQRKRRLSEGLDRRVVDEHSLPPLGQTFGHLRIAREQVRAVQPQAGQLAEPTTAKDAWFRRTRASRNDRLENIRRLERYPRMPGRTTALCEGFYDEL